MFGVCTGCMLFVLVWESVISGLVARATGVLRLVSISIPIPRKIAERVRREAEKLGLSLEGYVVELLVQSLDPKDRALEYIEAAKELLLQARVELGKGDLRQAAEKMWGATALAIKAFAEWREGRRLSSHRELWEYKDVVANELGEWVRDSWNAGNSMHTCFYEGWCTKTDVEKNLAKIEKLVREIEARIRKQSREH